MNKMRRKPNNSESVLEEVLLKRFFVIEKKEKFIFDGKPGRSQLFSDSILYGLEKGLLYTARTTSKRGEMRIEYRLSERGKEYFAIE